MLASEPLDAQLVSIQPPGKSEQMLLYEMRVASRTVQIGEAVHRNIPHVVCIDDVIGSGDTIVDCLFGSAWSPPSELSCWLASEGRSVTVLAAVANSGSIRRIENEPRGHGRVRVRAHRTLGAQDGIFAPAARVFSSTTVGTVFRQICEELGGHLFPGSALGWGECAWGVVTEYNVPDCSLPVIWREDPTMPWTALFPRR
jgi:hypothetical protein